MTVTHDFSVELHFTAACRQTAGQHTAIREADCLKAQFAAVLTEMLDGDKRAGRSEWETVGCSPHNEPPGLWLWILHSVSA